MTIIILYVTNIILSRQSGVEYVLGYCALFAGGFGGGNAPSSGPLEEAGKSQGEK